MASYDENTTNSPQSIPVNEAVERALETVFANSGYTGATNFQALEKCHTRVCVPLGQRHANNPQRPQDTRPVMHHMRQCLATPAGKDRYRLREIIPKPVFG